MRVVFDLDELERELDAETAATVLDVANEWVNQLQIEAPTGATGDLQRSMQIFQTGEGEVVLGSRIPYARFVNDGTRPHTPPFAPFQVWARRVLGNEGAAGAVWNSVRMNGTEANPFVDRAMENTIARFR